MAVVSDSIVVAQLRDELSIPAGEDARINSVVQRAKQYVGAALNGIDVDSEVWCDCVVTCAADLYNSRNARLGVMDAGTDGVEPFRVPTDPLRAVWPKLNAAGVLTGGSVIA